jgi:hypothetical protein
MNANVPDRRHSERLTAGGDRRSVDAQVERGDLSAHIPDDLGTS